MSFENISDRRAGAYFFFAIPVVPTAEAYIKKSYNSIKIFSGKLSRASSLVSLPALDNMFPRAVTAQVRFCFSSPNFNTRTTVVHLGRVCISL